MGNTPCTSFSLPVEFVTRLDEQVGALNVSVPMSASRATVMRMAYYETTREESAAHERFEAALARLHAGSVQGVPSRIVSVRLSADMRDGLNALAERHDLSVSCVMALMLDVSHHPINGMAFVGSPVDG